MDVSFCQRIIDVANNFGQEVEQKISSELVQHIELITEIEQKPLVVWKNETENKFSLTVDGLRKDIEGLNSKLREVEEKVRMFVFKYKFVVLFFPFFP